MSYHRHVEVLEFPNNCHIYLKTCGKFRGVRHARLNALKAMYPELDLTSQKENLVRLEKARAIP